jgi:hypothetical protein
VTETIDFNAAAEALRQLKRKKVVPDPGAIVVEGGRMHEVVDAASNALVGHDVYQRGGVIVYVGTPPKLPKWIRERHPGLPMVSVVGPHHLATELTRAGRFVRFDAREGAYRPIDCPIGVAKSMLESAGHSPLRVLHGLVFAPTIRPDWSLLSTEGYDRDTGLLASFLGTKFGPIPDEPTRADATAALELLLDVVRDFPFESEVDRAVAISAMLTAVVRPALRTAPLHAFSAHKQRSGKSLLAALPAYLATGGRPTVVAQNSDAGEEKKRLLSLLLAGDPVISFDNVSEEGTLESDALCSALTEVIVTDRLLGASTRVSVAASAMFEATGNNLTIKGDLTSRSLMCRIDPQVERPEERDFDTDLHVEIPRRRGELVVAALTLVRAYHVAGDPAVETKKWGGFEDWCRFVRDPLVWIGLEDPVASRRTLEASDPVRTLLVEVLESWHAAFGHRPMTIPDALRFAGVDAVQPAASARLGAALEDVAEEKGTINRKKLGKYFLRHVGRIEKGLRLLRGGTSSGRVEWVVEQRSR